MIFLIVFITFANLLNLTVGFVLGYFFGQDRKKMRKNGIIEIWDEIKGKPSIIKNRRK